MNQVITEIYKLLERHALANDEVSGFRFLTSQKFKNERQLFFRDVEDRFKLHLSIKENRSIKNLAQLIRVILKKVSAFQV